jgi:hypothetical protein
MPARPKLSHIVNIVWVLFFALFATAVLDDVAGLQIAGNDAQILWYIAGLAFLIAQALQMWIAHVDAKRSGMSAGNGDSSTRQLSHDEVGFVEKDSPLSRLEPIALVVSVCAGLAFLLAALNHWLDVGVGGVHAELIMRIAGVVYCVVQFLCLPGLMARAETRHGSDGGNSQRLMTPASAELKQPEDAKVSRNTSSKWTELFTVIVVPLVAGLIAFLVVINSNTENRAVGFLVVLIAVALAARSAKQIFKP